MFEVPHNVPRANPRRLAMLWMGIAMIHSVMRWQLYSLVFQILPDSFSGRWIIHLVNLAFSVVPVILQWLVLRRFFPGMRRWVGLHSCVLLVQTALGSSAFRLIERIMEVAHGLTSAAMYGSFIDLLYTLFWALMTGIVGWIIFQPLVPRPRLWLWAVLLGALLQWLVFLMLPPLEITYTVIDVLYDLADYGSPLLVAAIQAAVLMLFVRDRQRPATASTV